jgi:phosphoglycerate dehydrogenase-like enzyme
VLVVRRSAATAGPGVETVSYTQLRGVLPRADWLVLACPLNAETHGLVDADALRALPHGAHLINVARGEVVVQAALVEALQRGHLAGAFLDVFEHEPLPAESPLWKWPNVIVTPHSAGYSDSHAPRVAAIFADNLQRWLQRQPLLHAIA